MHATTVSKDHHRDVYATHPPPTAIFTFTVRRLFSEHGVVVKCEMERNCVEKNMLACV